MEERMKNKVFTIALLLTMMSALGIWAQNLPANLWSSPQSTTTEGRYRSNADNFIRPDAYTGVRFDKWFGMVSFLWNESYSAVATAGFATKVSNVYIGGFYSGNFWTWAPPNNYTEQQFVAGSVPNGGQADTTYNVYNNISVVPGPVNNGAIIIGVADMGFRLTYRTNYQHFNESGIVYGDQVYNTYKAEGGYIAPQIAWAMAKNMTKNGIRPYITADLVFDRDYQKVETAGVDADSFSGTKITRSLNHLDPSIGLGLGGYTFLNKDGFGLSFDFDYVFTMNIYNNEYSYEENGQYKTAKIKGTYSPGLFPYVERSNISNLLTPSLSGQWSSDRLALRFKLNLPLTLINAEQNRMRGELDSANNLVNGQSDSSFTFTFRPDLRLALQYKIIPDRLTLNAGARIQTTALTRTTITRKSHDENGQQTSVSKVHQNSYADNSGGGSSFVSRFHIGPTFNFTENVWLEATTGVSNAFGNEGTVDVFGSGGLFSFGSIMVGLKF
jgi:hypothetical protein